MKKINKLQVNPERLIKNKELMSIQGGYGTGCCMCTKYNGICGYVAGTTANDCLDLCHRIGCWGLWIC